jgi:hypothetical protein
MVLVTRDLGNHSGVGLGLLSPTPSSWIDCGVALADEDTPL